MENKISVVILNWLRPDNLRYHILPTLIKCPIIDEIIISHGRKDTFMKFYSRKINLILFAWIKTYIDKYLVDRQLLFHIYILFPV